MTKKMNQFLRHSESEYSPGSTSVQVLSQIGKVLVDELAESLLCGSALAFDRLAKSPAFNFNAFSSNCIVVVLVLVVQVRDQFIQAILTHQ